MADGGERPWPIDEMVPHDRVRCPGERRPAAQHLVRDTREAVLVAAPIELGRSVHLLGAHVVNRPQRQAGQRATAELDGVERVQRQRDPEVEDQGASTIEHHVLGLDVPVHDVVAVREIERARDVFGDAKRVGQRETSEARESRPQCLAFDERHDVVRQPVDVA